MNCALLADRSASAQVIGAMLMGWGAFNVVEGLVDHHILQLHHVYEILGQSRWDSLFLAWGAAMLLIGWAMVKRGAGAIS